MEPADRLAESGGEVVSVGKIADIFAHQGITRKVKANGIDALFDTTLEEMDRAGDQSLVFTNFVDFDSAYGHRRDIAGYAAALEHFDKRLPELLEKMQDGGICCLSPPTTVATQAGKVPTTPVNMYRFWCTVRTSTPVPWGSAKALPTWDKLLLNTLACLLLRAASLSSTRLCKSL